MAAEITDLQERKRELLARSDFYRQSIEVELSSLKTATAWVPRTIKIARAAYPLFLLAAPLLGYAFTRKRARPEQEQANGRRGFLASALAGYRLFNRVKPLWDGLRSWKS